MELKMATAATRRQHRACARLRSRWRVWEWGRDT